MFNVFSVVKILSYLGIVIIVAGGLWYAMNLKAELPHLKQIIKY